MATPAGGDYFDRARAVAASICLAASAAAIIGATLPWVRITPVGGGEPRTIEGVPNASQPFTGFEARDGWYVAAAALVIAISTVICMSSRRRGFAWIAAIAAVVIGAIAIADLRAIDDTTSAISRRMNIIGDADPGFGLLLVGAAGIVALVGAVGLLTAMPPERRGD